MRYVEDGMSLVKRGDIWHYDCWFQGRRYVGTTRQYANLGESAGAVG
jgi:hypothetical protein